LLNLNEQPFASLLQVAWLIYLPRTRVDRRLAQSLGSQVCHLRWVRHRLLVTQNSNRVEFWQTFLSLLTTQQWRSCDNIVILDELWFGLNTDRDLIWLWAEKKVSDNNWLRQFVLTMISNSTGFHLINVLSKGIKFTTSH
jgi:hypothetical protein